MTNRLQGKVALITGGTNGIGKATVYGMTQQGAKVVFTGNNAEAGAEIAAETGAVFVQHAVQDVDGWETVKTTVREQFGRLDITFSNAGTNAGDSDIETVEVDAWKNLLDINLTGMMLAIKASIELMKGNRDQSGGSIILNSSINGIGIGIKMACATCNFKYLNGCVWQTLSCYYEWLVYGYRNRRKKSRRCL